MSRRRKLEDEPSKRSKRRQARHVERTNYHDERSNENIKKGQNKIICSFIILSSGIKRRKRSLQVY
jgi:hypothetical protein